MLTQQLQSIFEKVQRTTGCHQKCVVLLTDIYKKTPEEEFLRVFLESVGCIIISDVENSKYNKRCLNFVSLFCADVTKKQTSETEGHEFLTVIIQQILKWSSANSYDVRYNCCYLLAEVLQDIGEEVQLEVRLIDEIQMVLLERMQETKIPIRIIAMSAMVRLQDPQNFDCPVIEAYMQAILSGSAQIRKASIESIAPNVITLVKIKERIRDVDPGVRLAAFQKCADIGPLNFRIADKMLILLCGFQETHEKVKKTFIDYLLPKWLTAYQGNYLKFIEALKLLALEEDTNKMTYLSRQLIQEFYSKHSINDLIEVLPLNDEKLVDIENLTNSVTLFWNVLVSILRQAKNMDEYLSQILPELTQFCYFIESVIKSKLSEQMDEWRFLEYQFDLLNLLEIAENYDFSDEVGRRTMRNLSATLLQNHNFSLRLTKKIVVIAHKCSSTIEFFINDMCQLISDIREPLVAEQLPEDQRMKVKFKMTQIGVQINVAEEAQDEAVQARDFKKAQELNEQLAKLNNQLAELQNSLQGEKVRVAKSDNDTICRCLDILSSVLELPAVKKMTPTLLTYKNEFLIPLISVNKAELHWRVLKCLALLSVIDKATAEEYAKIICIPIITYRAVPINNVSALTQSICSITDLISLYGIKIIYGEDAADSYKDDNTRRKLYSTVSEDDMRIDNVTSLSLFEIFLDMLDDERKEIRLKAVLVIIIMMKDNFEITPSLLSRILLKWFNPETEKTDPRLQVCLGMLIQYHSQFKNFANILRPASISMLTSIIRAPKTSSLASIDGDNVLMFVAEVMNIHLEKEELKNFALDISNKISENPSDRIVPNLVKLLNRLDVGEIDVTELIECGETCLENIVEKTTRRSMEKYLSKLKQTNSAVHTILQTIPEISENDEEHNNTVTKPVRISNIHDETTMKTCNNGKRSKNQTGKDSVVVMENVECTENTTILHTILETSIENEVDDNLTIESFTSESSRKSSDLCCSSTTSSRTSNSDTQNKKIEKRQSNRVLRKAKVDENDSFAKSRYKRRSKSEQNCVVLVEKLDIAVLNHVSKSNKQTEILGTKENESTMKKPQQVKRKKHRNNNMEVLETLGNKNERNLPVNFDIIETKSHSAKKFKSIPQNYAIVSETSDSSDFSGDSETKVRKSTRCRKKRIIKM